MMSIHPMKKLLVLLVVAVFSATSAGAQESYGGMSGGGEGNIPETYTVQPGDTLWSLSERFLNDPWYWPKMWSYNPSLDNPNWIRPGTVLRFYPSGGQKVEVVNEEPAEEVRARDPESQAVFQGQGTSEKLRALNSQRGIRLRRQFFVPSEVIEKAGTLEASGEENSMLSRHDRAWVNYKSEPANGDRKQVFRVVKELEHPVSGAGVGSVVEIVGEVGVKRIEDGRALVEVLRSFDALERGDFVARLENVALTRIEPVPNGTEAKGYVIGSSREELDSYGENHFVFVDKGEEDGVKVGNIFTVVRSIDPINGENSNLTDEIIGRILVTDLRTEASSGVVIYSNRTIQAGDRIELRLDEN